MRFPILAVAVLVACGGGDPEPKSQNDVVGYKGPQSSSHEMASVELPPDAGAPAPTMTHDSPPPPPPTATTSEPGAGDMKAPPTDDPFLAHHQMPPDEVFKTMRPAVPKVQACFRAALKKDPSASGEVKIRFVVDHEGKPVAWRDEASSMSDEETTKCIGEMIMKLKFPVQAAPGPAFGIYSIHLTP